MAKKISIVHITPFFSPNVGGVETHLNDLVGYLSKKNYTGYVLTYQALVGNKKGRKKERIGNFIVNRFPWFSGLYYKTASNPILHFLYLTPWLLVKSLFFVNNKKNEIDVIHAHGINAAYVGAVISKLYQKELVVSMHVDVHFKKESVLTSFLLWPLKSADTILVLTKHSKDELVENGISESKVQQYSYWVDQKIFKPLDKKSSRKSIGIKNNNFTVLFVGRLAREKGINLLLKTSKKMKNINFVFVGAGDLKGDVLDLSKKRSNVYFAGRVENKQLPEYYNASDCLIVPSLIGDIHPTFEEGVPRVILEALSCDLPIIGTDNGGIKDVIEDGNVGIVVKSDEDSITSVLKKIQSNKSLINKFRRNARKYAIENFSEKVANVFDEQYLCVSQNKKVDKLLENTGDMVLKRRAKMAIRNMDLKKSDDVLDVGCGDGFYLHLLSNLDLNLKLTGSDFDNNALNSAKKNLAGKKIKLVQADLMKKLPFKNNSFDKVIMSEVAEHLPSDVKGLKEVFRVMKPEGILCLTVPNANYPFFWDPVNWLLEHLIGIHIKSGFWAGIWNQHERLYTPGEISKVLKKSGFKVEKNKAVTRFCIPFNHNLLNLAARRLYGGSVSEETTRAISKFKAPSKRPSIIDFAFKTLNGVDKLNNFYTSDETGVSVFVKASK